jgi:hypothetical protein
MSNSNCCPIWKPCFATPPIRTTVGSQNLWNDSVGRPAKVKAKKRLIPRQQSKQRQRAVKTTNMYVDPAIVNPESSMSTKKDDVKEATEALKGMLGLGGSGPVSAASAVVSKSNPHENGGGPSGNDGGPFEAQEGSNQANPKPKKKRNNNSNKKKKSQGGGGGEVMAIPPKPTKPKKDEPVGAGGSKKQQTNKQASLQQKNKKNQLETTENFAWSAFQSSPDASKLPIPAFTSAPNANDDVVEEENLPSPVNLNLSDSDRASPVKTEDKSTEPTHVEWEDSAPTTATSTTTTSGGGGVNLAALAAAGPTMLNHHPNHHHPHALQPPPPHGPPFPPSQLFPMPPPPPPNFFPHPMPHGGPYAPPGFVTIRVQLPPLLPANRTLIVANPAGFPVQVHIPEQYSPNQIISVNVPSGPPLPPMPFAHHQHR